MTRDEEPERKGNTPGGRIELHDTGSTVGMVIDGSELEKV